MFRAIAMVLAVRVLLLLALLGGFALAVMAMMWQGQPSLFVLVAYSMLVMLPLVWLETRRPGV